MRARGREWPRIRAESAVRSRHRPASRAARACPDAPRADAGILAPSTTSSLTSFGSSALCSDPDLAIWRECWYWIRKLQARFFAGDHASAIAAASRAQQLLWTSPSQFEMAEYHFYGALVPRGGCDCRSRRPTAQHMEALAAHHRQLQVWAENCPENFENRAALVGAEIARLEGRELDAERLYEQAIRSARTNGFVHNEALAYERARELLRGAWVRTDRCSVSGERSLRLPALGRRRQGAATRGDLSASREGRAARPARRARSRRRSNASTSRP